MAKKLATPTRFVLARMRRGLATWQVADACGITRRRMSDIERGRVLPRDEEVARVADHLRFPGGFFFRPHIDIPRAEQCS
jgi:transcriptional regulator with XRE-family HTH domain